MRAIKKHLRRFMARVFLEIIIKPAGWHAFLDHQLRNLQSINLSIWQAIGVKMLTIYEKIYGPDD